ncbi:trypsin-like peptidase domain-containing protein [Methylomonas sp. MV1]|uniref:VMAP-C domain-containing protein n=1 Tax=Methylomonas sp. MV1 TaxID=3073620 RepID=UPI0028A3A2A6|nr:trypsin-like peptidase domain-containing protein [Methylomonas sp. MV1]MDT4328926.1 trypsin-like peptidase domain-containing protein [Methylomonas sp. MV1]
MKEAALSNEFEDSLESVVQIIGSVDGQFGTGFVFLTDGCEAWIITCSHVVRDVGGGGNVRINDPRFVDDTPEILACADEQQADLAVLKAKLVSGCSIPAFKLGLVGQKDLPCRIIGFTNLTTEYRRAEPLNANTGYFMVLQGKKLGAPRIPAWKLWLDDRSLLQGGYSGSPVLCPRTRLVFAVASHNEFKGERGYAISLVNLGKIWPELPENLIASSERWPGQSATTNLLTEILTSSFINGDNLRNTILDAIPRESRHIFPSDEAPLIQLQWLIDRPHLLLVALNALTTQPDAPELLNSLPDTIEAISSYFSLDSSINRQKFQNTGSEESPVLLVEIWPAASPVNRCNVQVRLFQSGGIDEGQCVYVREGDQALWLHDRDQITDFVTHLREIIVKSRVDENRLVVEFALPFDLLSHNVDQWVDRIGDPLGSYLPVVVRSRERLHAGDLQQGWHKHWDVFHKRFNDKFPEPLWWMEKDAQRQIRGKLGTGVCVALNDTPDLVSDECRNLLFRLTYSGASAVLWARQKEGIADLRGEIETFLTGKPLGQLPRLLRDLRCNLWEQQREGSICFHITLLWDDPNHGLPPRQFDEDFLLAPI